MPKKKKTQLKPVNRGFATTSIASKKAVAEEQERKDAADKAPKKNEVSAASVPPTSPGRSSSAVALNQEELELRAFSEKWQEKTEREIGRTLKAIEVERRLAESYTVIQLASTWRDRMLDLLRTDDKGTEKLALSESEAKLLPRLGHLYGVLRRMGVGEERTLQCLHASRRLELEEALEWLYLHSEKDASIWDTDSKLDCVSPRNLGNGYTFNSYMSTLPPSSSMDLSKAGLAEAVSRSSILAPADNPPELSGKASRIPDDHSASNMHITEHDIAHSASEESDVDSSSDSDPNVLHALLRLKLLRLQRKGQPSRYAARIATIERRIDAVKNEYMFSKRLSQAEYEHRKAQMEKEGLQARLKLRSDAGRIVVRSPEINDTKPVNPVATSVSQAVCSSSAPDSPNVEHQEVEEETMFGNLLEELPTEEITPTGTVVTIRDMAIPRALSNKLPTSVLTEAISKFDRYATVQYQAISGSSRAVRCACTIRWTGGKTDQWVMDSVACRDSIQAEQYVATLALHDVQFRPSIGFAGGVPASSMAVSYHRNLPPAYRELWEELEVVRKRDDEAYNRSVWGRLKGILQQKMAKEEKIAKEQKKEQNLIQSLKQTWAPELTPEQVTASLHARQSTQSYKNMLVQRQQLPIAAYRQQIIQTLEDHQVLVLSGETGCGKSTQLPAFVMEDQLSRGKACKIICTEPRRISAISLAQRVSAEMGEPSNVVGTNGSLIGYSIRLESNITRSTRLAFVTNGIALRMLEGGSSNGGAAIDEVTHLIVDEVHERSIESDFLLIILKSLLEQRPHLRVVLMSATLDADKMAAFFGNCPIIHVPGRTFPVEVKYLEDAVELTGWCIDESSPYARRRKDKYSRTKMTRLEWAEDLDTPEEEDGKADERPVVLEKQYSATTRTTLDLLDERTIPYELLVRMLEKICFEDEAYIPFSAAVLIFLPGLNEIRQLHDTLLSHPAFSTDAFQIYPLHSSVSSEGQSAVFNIPSDGIRKIVISTNISETGVTIPDITAVIDSGKHRQMMFDEKRQLSRLVETFIAKSNAAQRRGRAGRVRNGICFHLFTKARHDIMMADHPVPEMLRLSLSELALRTKIMKIDIGGSIEEILSRALDPPSSVNIRRAVASLVETGALTQLEDITPLGRYLAHLPTDVALGKFLLMAVVFKCLDPALTIAAALSSKSPFVTPLGKEAEAQAQKATFRTENSDFLTIHNAFTTWRRAYANGQSVARTLCRNFFLSYQNLQQIEEIRQQYLSYLVDTSLIKVDRAYERELSRARYSQSRTKIRFVTVPPELDLNSDLRSPALINSAIVGGLYPKILLLEGQTLRTLGNSQVTLFHPTSINFGRKPRDVATGGNALVYFTLMQSKKLYAWETGPVDDLSLILLCGDAEFKIASGSVMIDRKIKFRADARSLVVLKRLRERLQRMIQAKLSGYEAGTLEIADVWEPLAMAILGKKADDSTA